MEDKPKYDASIHHRRSIRLKGYDYSRGGLYFVTICCRYQACLFGEIDVGTELNPAHMILNKFGQIAYNEWLNTPEIRNHVALGEFVVMPNHIHGIIQILDEDEWHSPDHPTGNLTDLGNGDSFIHATSDSSKDGILDTTKKIGERHSPLHGPSNSIGAIVRGYKSTVTKQLNILKIGCPVWQRNYYEHIIRDEPSYIQISNYIKNNPEKWANDRYNTK